MDIVRKLKILIEYIEAERFCGYDPYDTLNSKIPFNQLGKFCSVLAIQLQKRNPVNIRPWLGIKKERNPKGMGILLKAYTLFYKISGENHYLERADYIFSWLNNNYSKGYSGKCWGYNFDWASSGSYLKAYTPSVVVTSYIIDGIYEYYKVTNNVEAKQIISSAANYIEKDIPVIDTKEGISFSYTHLSKGVCYNASLLAAEILAKSDHINNSDNYTEQIEKAVKFIVSCQKEDGSWFYSYDPVKGVERRQIDFHQGFILVSLHNIMEITGIFKKQIHDSISKGLQFYYKEQFQQNGRSLWRLPEKWPIDIHNQSQGIITFSRLRNYNPGYGEFAKTIAEWTTQNMQDKKGFFYYRIYPSHINRIPYIRWSQAWMMLALTELLYGDNSIN